MPRRAHDPEVHTTRTRMSNKRALEKQIVGKGDFESPYDNMDEGPKMTGAASRSASRSAASHGGASSHGRALSHGQEFEKAWKDGFEQELLQGGLSWSDVGKFVKKAAKNPVLQKAARAGLKLALPALTTAIAPGLTPVTSALVSGLGKSKKGGSFADNELRAKLMQGGKLDGRSVRAAIVKRVMFERKVSLPVASAIVKREGLY